jgi:hypothetical protein
MEASEKVSTVIIDRSSLSKYITYTESKDSIFYVNFKGLIFKSAMISKNPSESVTQYETDNSILACLHCDDEDIIMI